MAKTYKERLIENIDAIGVAHTQMMTILKEEIDLEKVNEDKWKAVAEGKGKAQEVADKLLNQLKLKETELESLKSENPTKEESKDGKIEEETPDNKKKKGLNNHLQ